MTIDTTAVDEHMIALWPHRPAEAPDTVAHRLAEWARMMPEVVRYWRTPTSWFDDTPEQARRALATPARPNAHQDGVFGGALSAAALVDMHQAELTLLAGSAADGPRFPTQRVAVRWRGHGDVPEETARRGMDATARAWEPAFVVWFDAPSPQQREYQPAISGRRVLGGRRLWLPAAGPQIEVLAPGAEAEPFAGGTLLTDTGGRGQAVRDTLALNWG